MACGPCCPGKPETKKIVVGRQEIGISGYDEAIRSALAAKDASDEELRAILLKELKRFNYIPRPVESEYVEGIWKEFLRERERRCPMCADLKPASQEKGPAAVVESYGPIPRDKVPWYPTIISDKCSKCGVCVEFCHKGVYVDGPDGPVVKYPYKCVVACTGCRDQCPAGAIEFPSMVELREALKRLRKEYGVIG